MLLPCLYKASKTCQNDLMESADIGKERDRGGTVVICRRRRENLTTLLRIRRVKPQKGNSIFYLPKEFSMTKWETILFSCKIAEDLNSSFLRGLNRLSVFKDNLFFWYTYISIYEKPKGCLSLGHFNHNNCYYTSLIRCTVRERPGV